MSDDPDHLDPDELVVTGGNWSGLLFENRRIGIAPQLTWTFTIDFVEVDREFDSTACSLAVDWVPLPETDWRSVAPLTIRCDRFAEPVECSVYFFEHHRYDRVVLTIDEQRGSDLHVSVRLEGDVDDLGPDHLDVDAWLSFHGILLALDAEPTSLDDARTKVAAFTSVTGLTGRQDTVRYRFDPPSEP